MIFVMAGLVPAIHVFSLRRKKDVDARHKAGHDGYSMPSYFNSSGHEKTDLRAATPVIPRSSGV
jgi:hypothetical protein